MIEHHRRPFRPFGIALALLAAAVPGLMVAGPPFMTDDPEPVDLGHWEVYIFGQGDRAEGGDSITAPAVEANYGVAPNLQFHLVAPIANYSRPSAGWATGYGDTEAGLKYRFVRETDSMPQVGIFPLVELATGNSSKGLGNGKTWYKLPVWAQKSWGPWTSYGGGGEVLNPAPSQRNYAFAGWLIQRDIGKYLTLGGELFQQGATSSMGRPSTLMNFGGYLKFSDSFNLLFSTGRSIAGERHTIWYLGLYWTGGDKSERVGVP